MFAPESVQVPEPFFVTVAVDVPMIPLSIPAPVPVKIKLNVPVIFPLNVIVPLPDASIVAPLLVVKVIARFVE